MELASKKNNYHYNKKLQNLAKENKRTFTKSAATMWSILKAGNIKGYKFRRERPILSYIVDFCCLELMLIIEVDGLSHNTEQAVTKDAERDRVLESIEFSVLRFDALYVLDYSEDMTKDIFF